LRRASGVSVDLAAVPLGLSMLTASRPAAWPTRQGWGAAPSPAQEKEVRDRCARTFARASSDVEPGAHVAGVAPALEPAGQVGVAFRQNDLERHELVAARPVLAREALALETQDLA